MLVLNANDVRAVLPMDETIEAMKRAFQALSAGQAEIPLRLQLDVRSHNGVALFMPVFVQHKGEEALTLKAVSVFPHNTDHDLPIINAAVLVFEANTGRPLALLEGSVLTAIRTGAASGAATTLLARADRQVAAIFGAGVQGRTQLEAICTARSIERAWIYDPSREKIDRFLEEMSGRGSIPSELQAADNPSQAVSEADVICTATTSTTPVFNDEDLKPGVHINAVGSYTPEMQEIPFETVHRALVVVDSRDAALAEAGDLIQPIGQKLITKDHIHAELGEIVSNRKSGRTSQHQITLFKSVGVAVQDAFAAQLALKNAEKQGLGQHVEW